MCVFQALTDQQQFGKADEMYDKCIVLEQDNATTYVHKGYAFLSVNTPSKQCESDAVVKYLMYVQFVTTSVEARP